MRGTSGDDFYRAGQQAWPRVVLAQARFVEHCERILSSVPEDETGIDGAAIYLCFGCGSGDAAAIEHFELHCLDTAKVAIARVRAEREFVDEALQVVRERLLVGPPPKVLDYRGRGPLQAWVRVAAQRVALDLCRTRRVHSMRQVELNERLLGPAPSPEHALLRERFLPQLRESLHAAVSSLSPQDRNVLRMHVVGQCSIDEIGRAYRVHRATAARWLERIRSGIHEAVRGEMAPLVSSSEFASLARDLGSELTLGLSASRASRHASQPSRRAD